MKAQPGSPNWHWDRLGYMIEREPRKSGVGNVRTIRDPEGRLVLQNSSYEVEMAYIQSILSTTRCAA